MIREARPADLPRLRAIQTTSLAEPWPGLLEPAVEGPPVVLAVTDGDSPVGYAVAIPEGDVAYLAEFAVAPGHRGQGHGSRLMSHLCGRLAREGFESLRLTVRRDDDRARSFYEDHGFVTESVLADHYESGEGLLLVRALQTSN